MSTGTVTFSVPNEHGVYCMDQCETVQGNGVDWRVRIHIANPGLNDWRVAVDVGTAHNGMGSLPSVSNRVYTTRVEAFYVGLEQAIEWFERQDKSYTCTEAEHKAIEHALAWCRGRWQLALF